MQQQPHTYNTMITILICDQLTQARSKAWLLVRKPVLVVRSLMRSRLLPNSWSYSVCRINWSVLNAYQLPNACLSGLEPLILCNGVTARGWPVNDWQWHDWCKYSNALSISMCAYTASQFCWLQCSFCNGMNVNASLLPALKPPDV
jgi:hypothetical protein